MRKQALIAIFLYIAGAGTTGYLYTTVVNINPGIRDSIFLLSTIMALTGFIWLGVLAIRVLISK